MRARPKKIAIVGGAEENQTYDPPVKNREGAIATARFIGEALAKAHYRIVVYAPDVIEKAAVEGFLNAKPPSKSIIVLSPRTEQGPKAFDQYLTNQEAFDPRPHPGAPWGFDVYRSISTADGLLLIGGGRFTFTVGMLGLTSRIPLVACAAYDGSAGLIWAQLNAGHGLAKIQAVNQMAQEGSLLMAQACVASFKEQMKQRSLDAASSARGRQRTGTVLAAVLGFTAILLCVLSWDNPLKLSPMYLRLIIFVVASLAGATGALLWNVLPFLNRSAQDMPDSVRSSWALGLIVGCIAALMYVVTQEAGFPELKGTLNDPKIEEFKADYLAKLVPSALITALVAGLTLDRVFKSLMKRQPLSDTEA